MCVWYYNYVGSLSGSYCAPSLYFNWWTYLTSGLSWIWLGMGLPIHSWVLLFNRPCSRIDLSVISFHPAAGGNRQEESLGRWWKAKKRKRKRRNTQEPWLISIMGCKISLLTSSLFQRKQWSTAAHSQEFLFYPHHLSFSYSPLAHCRSVFLLF